MNRPFSRLLITGLMALFVLVPSSAAFADAPSRVPLPFEPFTIAGACSFEVRGESLSNNNDKVTTFVDKVGNPRLLLFTGALRIRLTNLSTGKSLEFNSSSAGHVMPQADGSTVIAITGPWVGSVQPGALPNVSPRLFYFTGRAVVKFDASGNEIGLAFIGGQVQDLCAALRG